MPNRNWGLTEHELQTIPPALVRGFMKSGRGGFGAEIPGGFGRLLMREAKNSELYGPLQAEYLKGKEAGTDFWIHKNRYVSSLFFLAVAPKPKCKWQDERSLGIPVLSGLVPPRERADYTLVRWC
jgi:hypothetical protein